MPALFHKLCLEPIVYCFDIALRGQTTASPPLMNRPVLMINALIRKKI